MTTDAGEQIGRAWALNWCFHFLGQRDARKPWIIFQNMLYLNKGSICLQLFDNAPSGYFIFSSSFVYIGVCLI